MAKWYNNLNKIEEWYYNYSLLVEFYNIYGCLPKTNDKLSNYNIGRWLYTQKQRYKKGELPQVFVNLLNNISMQWI